MKGDFQTCWGSSLQMIKRASEQQAAIGIVLVNDIRTSHLVLTWQDCSVINSVIVALDLLGELTDTLSEKHITISAVKPLLNKLTMELLNETATDTSLTAQMKRVIKVDLESHYLSLDLDIPLFDVASFLDPCVKDNEQFTLEDGTSDKIKQLITDVLIPQDNCESAAHSENNEQSLESPPAK